MEPDREEGDHMTEMGESRAEYLESIWAHLLMYNLFEGAEV